MIFNNSFKTEAEYLNTSPLTLPQNFTFDVVKETWSRVDFTNKFINSLIISVSVTVITVTLSLLNGFAKSILKIPGRFILLLIFMVGMMIPPESLVYPLYYVFKQLGIYNRRISVILILSGLNMSFGTYLIATVLKSFPEPYLDSAKIDGCTKPDILWRIVLPVNKSVISVLLVFVFIWSWNDFFMSLIFLISNKIQTMPLAMVIFQGQHMITITMKSATALITSIPCIVFFVIFQRTITRGIVSAGVKG